MRAGIGYDIHRLQKGRKLILGGVEIPFKKGLLGHSDADVLLHAIIDALLGAAGMGDIGEHFPDTDARFKGASSGGMLKEVLALIENKGFAIGNVDAVVILEEPKLARFKPQIKSNLGGLLGIGQEYINIKAKTNEGIGEIGKGNAIAAHAIVLLEKK